MPSLKRRLLFIILTILFVLALGTGWYATIERWSLIESLYMTVITLSTVGFAEVRPLSDASRLFTVALILLGAGTVAYGLSSIGEYFLTAGVIDRIRLRSLMRTLKKMNNHIIICGAGRVGRTAAETLYEMERDFVIMDTDPHVIRDLTEKGWVALEGDSTHDDALREAGIERAAGILVCTGDDSDNLFIVLSARALNPELLIVARSIETANEAKMRRAGADRVISPYQIGGRHMATVIVRPQVARFLDFVTLDTGLELWLEEVRIDANSALAGKTVVETNLRRRTGVTIVALLRGDEKAMITPDENTRLAASDELIVLGTREQLEALGKLVN
ncbi:MAG TPA: potassium channel protein [Candidatus Sulfomarinibacteraceae bacterium]|nr:potassium channel protein [Candidatus Sulfomarinibacteraceae bacterium]